MLLLKTKVRKWGNSVGILLPKKFGIKPEQEITIHVEKTKGFTKVKDIFGTYRFKKTISSIMKQIDEELDVES